MSNDLPKAITEMNTLPDISANDSARLQGFMRMTTTEIKAVGGVGAATALEMIGYIRELENKLARVNTGTEKLIDPWNATEDDYRISPAAPVVDNEATQECAREISDLIWGEAKKLAQSFVDANIRNYNDHKGVESLERVYDAKRDTAQQIVNQMHNFREARWRRPKDIEAVISKHFPAAATAAPVKQSAIDLDPLEFWCDLVEVLGHPRPVKVNPVSVIAEVEERLRQIPPANEEAR